jgi:hypothetical protein
LHGEEAARGHGQLVGLEDADHGGSFVHE